MITSEESKRLPNREILFQNKNVLITGGASGIGKALAEQLRRLGAQVQILDKSTADVETIKGMSFTQVDVTDRESFQTKVTNQKIDILIIAAGVTSETNEPTHSEQQLMEAVNVNGVKNTLEIFGPHLTSDSQVVYIGTDNPPKAFYADTKRRGAQLVRDFATLHPDNKVKIILLGPVRTPLFEKGKPPEVIKRIEENVGVYEPHEFADELIDKLSDNSSKETENNVEEVTMYKKLPNSKQNTS